jgi:SulP family sulfate permease
MKPPAPAPSLRTELLAGVTVALVAAPQCMAFAIIAGLPPATGLYTAVVMGVLGALLASAPTVQYGPVITTSSMLFGIMATVSHGREIDREALAGLLAVLVGLFILVGTVLHAGQFVRFVSRSVMVGFTTGIGLLIFGSQLAPFLGLPSQQQPSLLGVLHQTVRHLDQTSPAATMLAAGTLALVGAGARWAPRWPVAFLALLLGGVLTWAVGRDGTTPWRTVSQIPSGWPLSLTPTYREALSADLFGGAAALAVVATLQSLTIARALVQRAGATLDTRRELSALGLANVAAGLLHGFPGSASFARSALGELAGARTRAAGLVCAFALMALVLTAAPLAGYIPIPVIAGLLVATAASIIEWREIVHILRRGRGDRAVLGTTVVCALVLPIHWAILIGLAASIAMFLRQVSRLRVVEMVAGPEQRFAERPLDADAGRSTITMLQVEGPLFFAHAEELAGTLQRVFSNRPRVTILRMRRAQQIDFSVIRAICPVIEAYLAAGGDVIICGLTPEMRREMRQSALGALLPAEHLLQTTREVFGSAHRAIRLAEALAGAQETSDDGPRATLAAATSRPLFRQAT